MTGFAREVALHWVGVALYIVAWALFANAVIFGHPARIRWARWSAALGLAPHGVAILLRWATVDHGPYLLRYEVLSSNSWMAVAALTLFLWSRPSWSALALVVMPAAILALAIGLFSNAEIRQIPPTPRSVWLAFHIVFAKLAAAAFLLSLVSSVIQIVVRRGAAWQWLARVPRPEVLDAYTLRFVGFGFLFWTVTIAAGAIWANQSWGRYWGWDAIETWSLVSWIAYGLVLHGRLFFRLRAVTTAWLTVGAFAVFILTLLILPFVVPSMHSAYFQ
jgi:ABC-type transport system involved in cytochrome c biogenesis permease subunit